MTTAEITVREPEQRNLDIRTVHVKVVGDSPLITHRFPTGSFNEKGVHVDYFGPRKHKRNPMKEFTEAIYWLSDEEKYPGITAAVVKAQGAETMDEFKLACEKGARFGMPTAWIKDAAIKAAYALGKAPDKVSMRGMFFIEPDDKNAGLLEIKSDPPAMRTEQIRFADGYITEIHKPEFKSWSCEFVLSYNANGIMPPEEIIAMIDLGGCVCGIGDWKLETGGKCGTFHVER